MDYYLTFKPSVRPLHDRSDEDMYYIYRAEKILIREVEGEWRIPTFFDIKDRDMRFFNKQCMGSYKGVNCYSLEILEDIESSDMCFQSLINCSMKMDEEAYLLMAKGKLLLDWQKRNKFCGVCGSKMYAKDHWDERSMICQSCSMPTWPRTSPAILVAITRGDKILLANNKNYPEGKYSILAGFVEYGESFEDAVRREVLEEVGIRIQDIEYYGSKPWPFPNSMMVAYKAKYKSGKIEVDKDEINHADWYSVDELPELFKNKNSIACELIDQYIEEYS